MRRNAGGISDEGFAKLGRIYGAKDETEGEPEKEEPEERESEDEDDGGDQIPGGLADDAEPEDFPLDQLLKGLKVELEHTDDPEVAMEIAQDHLEEFDTYYDALAEMEDELKSKKGGREDWPPHPYGVGWGSCPGCGQDVEDLPPGELCEVCSRWKTIEDEKRQEREQGYQDDLLDQVRGRSCR